jgi:hypothetical protein
VDDEGVNEAERNSEAAEGGLDAVEREVQRDLVADKVRSTHNALCRCFASWVVSIVRNRKRARGW